ncbi:MAG: hypothetical protein HYY25_11220 [Candidatus Wallbacteria bacterium]|nr:hypothetical protein [Candidatus Wallbacteria bacterium]
MVAKNGRALRVRLVAAAAAALSVATPGSAQDAYRGSQPEGLLEAVNGFVDRLDSVFDYQMAPEFRQNDLYGKRISLAGFSGRICILSFVDQKNEEEARVWLEDQSIDYMGDADLVFINVLYPGRIPFIVSRSNAVDSIRREVDKFLEQMWQNLSDKERDLFQRTTIRWVVDWKRDLQRAYNTTRDRMNLVVVDGQGRVRQIIRKKTPKTVEQLRATIAELKRERAGLASR